jgi:signal peptidase
MTTYPLQAAARRPAPAAPTRQANTGLPPAARAAKRLVHVMVTGLLILAAAAFLFLAVGPRVLGYQTSTMLTGSMAPMINPGDVVLSVPTKVQDLKVGDVITYHIPVEDHRVETHRIIELTHTPAGPTTIRTKGDANNGADPWTATMTDEHVYTTAAVIPHLGDAIRALRTPTISNILLYGAPTLLTALLLTTIWTQPKKDARVQKAGPGVGGRP